MPQSHFNMVRPGISLYGLYPSDEVRKKKVPLKPAMALKAKIIHLKKVPAGFKVSYGGTHETLHVKERKHFDYEGLQDGEHIFTLNLRPNHPGMNQYKIRLYPYHELLAHPLEAGYLIWL